VDFVSGWDDGSRANHQFYPRKKDRPSSQKENQPKEFFDLTEALAHVTLPVR
jgi:hypothetical protein